jgi:hypothetical protein
MTKTAIPVRLRLPIPAKHEEIHIHEPAAWWVVTYQGVIVNFSRHDTLRDRVHYTRNGWSQQASALNARDQLRTLGHTEDFHVVNLVQVLIQNAQHHSAHSEYSDDTTKI